MGNICPVFMVGKWYWQGEERDSSDEEWDSAYAAMDPISRLQSLHQNVDVAGPPDVPVRDVFVQSDAIHDAAMAEIAANTYTVAERMSNMDDYEEDCMHVPTEGGLDGQGSSEGEPEGEHMQHFL